MNMITLRMTEKEHQLLKETAWKNKKSLNKWCVETLLEKANEQPAISESEGGNIGQSNLEGDISVQAGGDS